MHLSKWTGKYCENDPNRTVDVAIEQTLLQEEIEERAWRGEVPGGGPGRKMIREGEWVPNSRTQFPPKEMYLDAPTGEFGVALRQTWTRALEESGGDWQVAFGFCGES
eukprot:1322225-Alexandrium_andersonii.AAC.1